MKNTNGRKRKAIVVESDRKLRRRMESSLRKNAFDVTVVENPVEAQAILGGTKPDIVLLDVEDSQFDALETCKWVRVQEHLKDVPVIMLSNSWDIREKMIGYRAGAQRCISKPRDMKYLLDEVNFIAPAGSIPPNATQGYEYCSMSA